MDKDTTTDLMQPRIKCLHDDWQNVFKKNDIIQATLMQDKSWRFYFEDDYVYLDQNEIKKYAHLFHECEWWEERKAEDMPEYLKEPHARTGEQVVCKAEWRLENGTTYCKPIYDNLGWIDVRHFSKHILPATEQEYNEYQKQNNEKTTL